MDGASHFPRALLLEIQVKLNSRRILPGEQKCAFLVKILPPYYFSLCGGMEKMSTMQEHEMPLNASILSAVRADISEIKTVRGISDPSPLGKVHRGLEDIFSSITHPVVQMWGRNQSQSCVLPTKTFNAAWVCDNVVTCTYRRDVVFSYFCTSLGYMRCHFISMCKLLHT